MNTLDMSVGFLLNRAARSMKRGLESRLVTYGLTSTQYIVLALLAKKDGLSQSQLGSHLYFDNPTVTGVIDRMERDGLVERRRTSGDRRVINIFLCDKARKILAEVATVADDLDREAMKEYSRKEQSDLIRMLNTIWEKMNGVS
ncbi:MAG TPA: MarR family transcriptional regulator [Bacteroidota bacterium]|nr:MarR family transcriptional regulator [Bacteroidota bacterium]